MKSMNLFKSCNLRTIEEAHKSGVEIRKVDLIATNQVDLLETHQVDLSADQEDRQEMKATQLFLNIRSLKMLRKLRKVRNKVACFKTINKGLIKKIDSLF